MKSVTEVGDHDGRADGHQPERVPRQHRSSGLTHILIIPIIVAALGAIVAGIVLAARPQASASNVQKFFNDYFSRVTQASQRWNLYQKDLTKDYRQYSNVSFSDYNSWWASVKQVAVNNVQSTSGNRWAFTVYLTYHMEDGKTIGPEPITYSLVCNGPLTSVAGGMPELCPRNDLQIESGLEGAPSNS